MSAIYLELLMLAMGVLSHFMKALTQMKKDGMPTTPKEYWRENPYHSVMTLIGAVVGFVALFQMNELSPITAFGVGFMANSVADVIGSRALNKL